MSLEEKINQLFILGYEGADFSKNKEFVNLLKHNLGGVIFFTQNILEEDEFKKQVEKIKNIAKTVPFLSIDEEGGRVERFENLNKGYKNGKKYLSAKYIVQKGKTAFSEQIQNISNDIKKFGLNMNFSPVLDVNSNSKNPIIGERAYSDNPQEVAKWGLLANDIFLKNNIITVGKHFPGHGDTSMDSHLMLPTVDIDFKTFEKIHLYPFKVAIEKKIPVIMVAHVYYKCFDENVIPASLSKNVLDYLKYELKYEGLIISDDMVMGGISGYDKTDAVIQMLKNGVNCLIFRFCNKEVVELIEKINEIAEKDEYLQKAIENSYNKILRLKKRFLL